MLLSTTPPSTLASISGSGNGGEGAGKGRSTLLVPAASILNGLEGLPREVNPTTQPSRTFSDAGFQVNESPCDRTVRKSTVSHHTHPLVPYNPPPPPLQQSAVAASLGHISRPSPRGHPDASNIPYNTRLITIASGSNP